MEFASSWINEPASRGSDSVRGESCTGAVKTGDGLIGEVVADQCGGGGGIVVLDGVCVVAK